MDNVLFILCIFFIQIILLYFISHKVIDEFFLVLHSFFHRKNTAYVCIAIIFFPGTLIHELSHFLFATVLFLRVHEVRVLPQWRGRELHLGSVTYEKGDIVRSILVGVAPFFGAFFFFWEIHAFRLFPHNQIGMNIMFGYLIFVVSSNMFSSKQDLIDLGYLVPFFIITSVLYYVFGLPLSISIPSFLFTFFSRSLQIINFYITISLVIQFCILVFIKSFRYILT